jgi:hypothetical protein
MNIVWCSRLAVNPDVQRYFADISRQPMSCSIRSIFEMPQRAECTLLCICSGDVHIHDTSAGDLC